MAKAVSVLSQEYAKTFGCLWDLTPWGERWGDVLERAHDADRNYNEAETLLHEVAGAFADAIDFLKGRGLHPFASSEPIDLAELAGHTVAEASLFLEVCDPGGAFLAATGLLQHLADHQARRLGLAADQLAELGDAVPRFVSYVDGGSAFNTSRALRLAEYRLTDNAIVRFWVPGLVGRPPRSLTSMDEWRRSYVVELLSVPSRTSSADENGREAPAYRDRAIALVVLLCGGIFAYSAADLAEPGALINAERKAVALTRRRRAFSEQVKREAEAVRSATKRSNSGGSARRPAVSSSTLVPRIKSSAAYRGARASLEREYRRMFGQDWDVPPWGRSRWAEIIPKALELDRAYVACVDRIERVLGALDRARAFLSRRGLDVLAPEIDPYDSDKWAGKTVPEQTLYRAFVMNDRVVDRAGTRLRTLLDKLQTDWNISWCTADGRADPPVGTDFTTVVNTVVPQRGLVHLTIRGPDGSATWSGWAPGILAPPPDSLREDAHEWRRWYVATTLDAYDRLRRKATAPPDLILELDVTTPPVVADRAVAVVSLLAGGLELYSAADLQALPNVINAERKAVALARKRARARLAAHWNATTTKCDPSP